MANNPASSSCASAAPKSAFPKKIPRSPRGSATFNLRDWLKAKLKEDGRWGPIRAISTSCMDVCARGRVTVCIEPQNGDTESSSSIRSRRRSLRDDRHEPSTSSECT